MGYSGAEGENWYMKKTRGKKSRDTVPLQLSSSVINIVIAKFVMGSTIQITFGFSPFDSPSWGVDSGTLRLQ